MLAPLFSQVRFSGLVVDAVRVTITRPPSEVVVQRTFPFAADSSRVRLSLDVPVVGSSEDFDATIELLAGTTVVFTGTRTVTVVAGQTAAGARTDSIPVSFVGPGSSVAALAITPSPAGLVFGDSIQFQVTATDSQQQPVAQFYVGWSSSASAHPVNATGLLRAGASRGSFFVVARTPTGIADTARVFVSPVPSAIAIQSGNGQTGAAGQPLAQPLVVRVTAADQGPVSGVTVSFAAASGGGSVNPASAVTDSLGRAATIATLGPLSGTHTFTASVAGLAPVTFSATVPAGPTIQLVVPGNLIGVGPSGAGVRLTPAAPAGGVTVTVTSDSIQYATVDPPGTVAFAQGDTLKSVALTGESPGVTVLRATAPGYASATLTVGVTPNVLIVTPSSPAISVGQTLQLGVQALPQPSGALTVALSSTDTTVVRVTAPSVTIPGGQSSASFGIQGVAAGVAAILVAAPGYGQGGAAVTVTTGGVPAAISKTAGDGLTAYVNDTTAARPRVAVLDVVGAPVAGVQVLFTIASGGGTIAGGPAATATTDAQGVATAPGTWRMGGTPGSNTLTVSLPLFPGVTAQTFTASAVPPPPIIQLSIFGSSVVGQARTGLLNVRLLQAAPAGGVTVNLTTLRTGLLRIGSYGSESGTASFAQGDTLQTVTVFGDSLVTGTDTVVATAPAYTPDTLAVPISINLISLPTTLNVPLSQNVSLPINLSVAAPTGGVKVAVTSSDPTTVQLLTDTVSIAQGSRIGNATLLGAALGTATVTATNPNYAPDVTTVNVTASLNITTATVSLNTSFGSPITVQLESGGLPVAAPVGGVPITLSSNDATCATAVSTAIPAGQVSVIVQVSYGGSATTPCSTRLFVDGPAGFARDSVTANVAVQPVIGFSTSHLGSGLQRGVSGSLGATNHGGTTVRVASSNPSLIVIARNDSTAGTTFVDIPVGINQSSFVFTIQALDGITDDSADVVITAPGFVTATVRQRVNIPAYDLIFLNGSGNTLTANDPFQLRLGSATSNTNNFLSTEDPLRFGRAPVTLSVINDSAAVGNLVILTDSTSDSVTVQIGPRQSRSPATVATGGVEFDYVAPGVTGVRSSNSAGFRPVASALGQTVTVTAPTITISNAWIGAHLQRQVTGSLSNANHGGVTVRLKANRPGVVLFSPDDSTLHADSVLIPVANGSATFSWWITGVDAIVADSVNYVADVVAGPVFSPDTAKIAVYQPAYDIIFLNSSGNTLGANDPFQVRLGSTTNNTNNFLSTEDVLRFGHAPIAVSVVSDSTAVGNLVILTDSTSDSVTVQIGARQSRSPSSVAAGGVEFDYQNAGVTTVRGSSVPGFRPVSTAAGQNVTVSAPSIFISNAWIGARLQRQVSGSLGATAHGGVTVRVKADRPGVVLFSPDDSTLHADSVLIAVPNGQSSFTWWITGVDGIVADSVNYVADIAAGPGFVPDTARIAVYMPTFDIIFLSASGNTLTADDPFQIRIGSATNNTNQFLSTEDELRFGHPTLSVSITSSQATVAQLVTSTSTGSAVSVPILARQSRTAVDTASGGVQLDYLTTGTTLVGATIANFRTITPDTQTVTVIAPTMSMSSPTVGSGLQTTVSVSLSNSNHGGDTLTVRSSNPLVLVSRDANTPGDSVFKVFLANGQSGYTYYVQGLEGHTGSAVQATLRATFPGFTDATSTATLVQAAVDVIFLAGSGSAAGTIDDPFNVRVGYANSPTNTFMQAEQQVRAGAPGPLTVTIQSSNPAAGLLKTTAQPTGASSVTVTIPVGQSRNQSSDALAFDFVAQGVTFVIPTVINFITVQQSAPPQPGFQVVVNP